MLHIKGCTGLAEAWETLCNIHKTKSLSNILFLRHKFFTIKMEEGTNILEHINKVKSLANQLLVLKVPLRGEDVVMTLLDNLPPSFDYLIIALETRPFKELTMVFVTTRLVHEESKRKEKEPQATIQPWCQDKAKGAPLTPRMSQGCASFVANPVTLHAIVGIRKTMSRTMPTMQKLKMRKRTTSLWWEMELTTPPCTSGSLIRGPLNT